VLLLNYEGTAGVVKQKISQKNLARPVKHNWEKPGSHPFGLAVLFHDPMHLLHPGWPDTCGIQHLCQVRFSFLNCGTSNPKNITHGLFAFL